MNAIGMRLLFAASLLGLAGDAAAQDGPQLGKQVRVTRPGHLPALRGELIAVSLDSLWVLGDSRLLAVPSREVLRVEVKRRPMGGGQVMLWGLIGGAISGAALTGACASYTGGCGGVLPGVMLTWAVWSGLWAAVAGSAYKSYPASALQTQVPAFARFPQGMPHAFGPGRFPPASVDSGSAARSR